MNSIILRPCFQSFTHCLQATDPAAEERALRGLARASTAAMISKTLEYAISPSVRSQDVSALLVGLAKQGGLGFNMTWEFIMSKADDIQAKFGGGEYTDVWCGFYSEQWI